MTVKSLQIVTKMEFEVLAKYCKSPLESSIKKNIVGSAGQNLVTFPILLTVSLKEKSKSFDYFLAKTFPEFKW